MIVLLNKYLLVNLLFLLFLFFSFTISHIKTVVSVKDDNEFFGIFPENYYDPRDYGEGIPSFSDLADIFIVNYASILYPTNYLLISVISLVADFAIYNIFLSYFIL
jgi:hypothetical protein